MFRFVLQLFLLCLAGTVAADELRPLPWSAALNHPDRFRPNSSGSCTVTGEAGKLIRVDAQFRPGTDFWCYPELAFRRPTENFEDAEELRFEIQVAPDPKGFRYAYVMFEGHPHQPLPRPDGTWQKVVINLREANINPEKVAWIRIGANPATPGVTFRIRNLEVRSSKPYPTKFDAADAIAVTAPGAMFLEGEEPSFTLRAGVNHPASYKLYDWQRKLLQTGKWPDDGKGTLRLPGLPRGYYMLELQGEGGITFSGVRSFAVVADPAKRKRNPDSFFALDSAQSWLARANGRNSCHPQDGFELVSEIARRSGAAMIRERMSWSETEPQPGQYRWNQYKTNADLLQKRDIPILGMYHNAPPWAKSATMVAALPRDLAGTYNYAKTLAEEFRNQMGVWEFWNEPDIYYTVEGAWDYASALKAAYLGYKAGNPDLPVALGGIAKTVLTPYCDTLMANAAGEYFDIFSIHSYNQLVDYPGLSRNIFAFLKRYRLDDRRAWMTENGCRAEGAGRLESYMKDLKEHTPEQELLVAEFLPKAMIQLQFDGFDRDFFFVLPPYSEEGGRKVWGLMRLDYTIKPALAAFANLAANLENAELEGEINPGAPEVRAFLYRQPDNTRTLVYWSKSELDTDPLVDELKRDGEKPQNFTLPVPETSYTGCNIFGTPFKIRAGNGRLALTATRMPAFLNGLPELPVAQPALRPGPRRNANESAFNRTIVFRTELTNDFTLSIDRESADICREHVFLKLAVWNLSDREQTGNVTITGGKVIGLPAECAIPAFSAVEYLLKFTPEINSERKGEFRVTGSFERKPATPLVIPLTRYNNLDKVVRSRDLPGMLVASNWRENSSGKMDITFDEKAKAIRFTTRFAPTVNDRWSYPEYILHLPDETLAKAIGLSFEAKAIPPYGIRQMLVMAVPGVEKEVGTAYFLKAANPGAEWETRTVSFGQHQFDPADIRMLRFGLNTTQQKTTFLIRNIKVLYGE